MSTRKKPYSSPRREAQARSTRVAILDSAQALFGTLGYTETTIAAIAAAAQVGQATVYAGFGSKRAILEAVLDRSIVGDDEPVPLDERPGSLDVLAAPDGRERVAKIAAGNRELLGRTEFVADIVTALDPSLAEMKRIYDGRRHTSVRLHIASMAAAGMLAPGLDPAEAEDIMWALISWELHQMLVRDRGWTPARYEAWLARLLTAALLPAEHGTERPDEPSG